MLIDERRDSILSDLLVITTGTFPPTTNPPAVAFIKLTIILTRAFPVSIFGTMIIFAFPATALDTPFILAASFETALSNASGPKILYFG